MVNVVCKQGTELYVKQFHVGTQEDDLRAKFAPFGTVASCSIVRSPTGAVGYVTFSTAVEAERAITGTHDTLWRGERLYVALKEEGGPRPRSAAEAGTACCIPVASLFCEFPNPT